MHKWKLKCGFEANQGKHRDKLVQSLEELRNQTQLCDVVILTEGKQFPAHKLVLAASSSFFQSLFTLDMTEKHKQQVELRNIDSGTMALVLDYIYTGTLYPIDRSEAADLYAAADYLILPGLKEIAASSLASSMTPENCLQTMLWAHRFSSTAVFAYAFRFVLDNFRRVSRTDDFLKLPPQQLRLFLCSDNLRIVDEEDVYEALKRWTEYLPDKRRASYIELFHLIRLEHISGFFLKHVIYPDVIRSGDEELRDDVSETLATLSASENSQCNVVSPHRPPRRYVAMVIALLAPDVYSYVPTTREWFEMTSIPTVRIFSSSAMCHGKIYNIGGCSEDGDSSNVVERFDPTANTWSSKASLPVPTRAAGLAFLEPFLYVVGGKSNSARFNIVQRYDPQKDTWSLVTSLQEPRSGAAVVGCHGNLYAIGGRKDENTLLNTVECYCPKENTWSWIAPMNVIRASAAAACIRDYIYVIGGVRSSGVSHNACEVYDIGRDRWNMIAKTVMPRSFAGIIAFDECLLVCGGEDENKFHDTIECYDIEQDKWQVVDKMPRDEKFVDCCSIFMSKDLLPIFPKIQ